MTPIASAVLLLLLGIDAHAAEETFDTNFMGGMKVRGFLIFASMITNPARANMILTSTSISSGVEAKYVYCWIIRMTPVYPRCINASGDNIQALDKRMNAQLAKRAVQRGRLCTEYWHVSSGSWRFHRRLSMNLSKGVCSSGKADRGINAFYTSYYTQPVLHSDYKDSGSSIKSTYAFHQRVKPAWAGCIPMPAITKPLTAAGWKSNTLYPGRGIPEILGTLRIRGYVYLIRYFDAVRSVAYGAVSEVVEKQKHSTG